MKMYVSIFYMYVYLNLVKLGLLNMNNIRFIFKKQVHWGKEGLCARIVASKDQEDKYLLYIYIKD